MMLFRKLGPELARGALIFVCANLPLSLASPVLVDDLGELDCVVEPHMVIDLSSRVDGIIDSLEVERGELIEKDQVLVRLEAGVERAGVAQAKVRAEATAEILSRTISLEFTQRRNDRIEELHRSQAVSTDRLDEIVTENELSRLQLQQARENKEIAELEFRQAREILRRHTLRSPIRGIVVQRYLSPGESVEEQPVMRLAQIDPLRVEVIVPVSAFGSIKVGQPAIVRPEPPMDNEYEANVTIVDGVADAASGTFRVRLGLPNEDYALPSGLKCRVTFLPMETIPGTQLAETEAPSIDPDGEINPVSTPIAAEARLCQTVGPFKNAPEAEQIMTTLAQQATQLKLREESQGSVETYLLLTPSQASPDDSRELTEKMQAAGFTDFHVFWRGPHKGRVSTGLYRKKAFAEERQAMLADLGFEVELVPRTRQRSQFWLDVELLPRITALDLAAARQMLGNADLNASACAMVADK